MNRYQFEDLISEYIENELSLSKRKEFETYLEENPDARGLVESIRTNMAQMKTIPKVIVSPDFNDRLLARIHSDNNRLDIPIISQRTIFGFTPIYASLMTGLVIAFVFPFDRLLDMMRTVTNISGDAAVACAVAKWDGNLDEDVFRREAEV